MNRIEDYQNYRNDYPNFIFESYQIEELETEFKINYTYTIENFRTFHPYFTISKTVCKKIDSLAEYMIFHIGMVEILGYWKTVCSPKVEIRAGFLDEQQIAWFKKLFYYGLGEFFYVNGITNTIDDFMEITCTGQKHELKIDSYQGTGSLIPIGGGKDSTVSLELLKDDVESNTCFMLNPKPVMLECAKVAGYEDDQIVSLKRVMDKQILELNSEGFLNGHTPFSALLAFMSYFSAYVTGKRYITLSNESSANEATVIGTKINHQYSKTVEFENDFNTYTKTYFQVDISYFSFLRPLSEFQIAMLFSHYEKFHPVFKSCNVGSKSEPWKWCCDCAKCLFVYIILSPFLYKDKLVTIFGENLYEKDSLLPIFLALTGNSETKPFECVGTTKEVRYAISMVITSLQQEQKELPSLLQYYQENYELSDLTEPLLSEYNEENNLPEQFAKRLRKEVENYVSELN